MTPREEAKEAVKGWVKWAFRNQIPREMPISQIVSSVITAYAVALIPDAGDWFPIVSVPEGVHVQLYFPTGERGNGGIECATLYHDPNEQWGYSFWTHGGPNAGSDWEPKEAPTHWRPCPDYPEPSHGASCPSHSS
jgi:hypothetical protein